jgi:hypothetical protein
MVQKAPTYWSTSLYHEHGLPSKVEWRSPEPQPRSGGTGLSMFVNDQIRGTPEQIGFTFRAFWITTIPATDQGCANVV